MVEPRALLADSFCPGLFSFGLSALPGQALLERKLCLRQEGQSVFPSCYNLKQPSGPTPLKYFNSQVFGGFLDEVYATLIVRLAYCGAFQLKELWRDAADFARSENPNGITSFSPGLRGTSYPGPPFPKHHQPQRGCGRSVPAHCSHRWTQPRWGCFHFHRRPRVARALQPWAGGHNPFGFARTTTRR